MVYPFPSEEPTLSYYNLGCAMVAQPHALDQARLARSAVSG